MLIKHQPLEVGICAGKPGLICHRPGQCGFGHMRLVRQDDDLFNTFQALSNGFDHRQEGGIHEQDPVFGMIEYINQLICEQARIDGVANGTDAHDPVPGFHVPVCIPRHGSHAVTGRNTFLVQRLGHA
jgi:hypothetical protein